MTKKKGKKPNMGELVSIRLTRREWEDVISLIGGCLGEIPGWFDLDDLEETRKSIIRQTNHSR